MLDIYGYMDNSNDLDLLALKKSLDDAGIVFAESTVVKEQPGYKFVDNVVPFPKHNRFGLMTRIHIFNELPVIKYDDGIRADLPKYIVREEKELDFWNEVRGFFVANENNGVIVHDIPKFELPTEDGVHYIDATEKDLDSLIGWAYNPVVGDRIIMPDYKVYTVIGFNHSSSAGGGATISFDVQ
jgi:hypothetical protein